MIHNWPLFLAAKFGRHFLQIRIFDQIPGPIQTNDRTFEWVSRAYSNYQRSLNSVGSVRSSSTGDSTLEALVTSFY